MQVHLLAHKDAGRRRGARAREHYSPLAQVSPVYEVIVQSQRPKWHVPLLEHGLDFVQTGGKDTRPVDRAPRLNVLLRSFPSSPSFFFIFVTLNFTLFNILRSEGVGKTCPTDTIDYI